MSKLAFLGAGNMAGAIIDGLLARSPELRGKIMCLGGSGKSAAALAERTGVKVAKDIDELLDGADVVIVAFKPQQLSTIDARVGRVSGGKLMISVLAGKTLETLIAKFPYARNVVRTMPNTPAAIGEGITPYCSLQPLRPADRAQVEMILSACGQHVEIAEEHMDAATAVSGCGPAFLFEFVAALRDGGIAAKLPAEVATRLAVQTAYGAAKLLAQRKTDPETLRNQVTSPNGATLAGLRRMEAGNFRTVIRDTALAAQARAAELSKA